MTTEKVPAPQKDGQARQAADDFDVHRQLVFWLFVATGVIVVITAIALFTVDRGTGKLTILPVVALAGVLGAFVSALRRLYSFQDIFPSERYRGLLRGANLYVVAYSCIPPLIGLIAAVVLYVVFAANLLTGSAFPSFVCAQGEGKCPQFTDFVQFWKPSAPTDYAKAIVWGFVAGFSERFVPDILNRLAEKSGGKGT